MGLREIVDWHKKGIQRIMEPSLKHPFGYLVTLALTLTATTFHYCRTETSELIESLPSNEAAIVQEYNSRSDGILTYGDLRNLLKDYRLEKRETSSEK